MSGPSDEVNSSKSAHNASVEVTESDADTSDSVGDISPHVVELLNRASQAIKEERQKVSALEREVDDIKKYLRTVFLLFLEEQKLMGKSSSNGPVLNFIGTSATEIASVCGVTMNSSGDAPNSQSVTSRATPSPNSSKQVPGLCTKPMSGGGYSRTSAGHPAAVAPPHSRSKGGQKIAHTVRSEAASMAFRSAQAGVLAQRELDGAASHSETQPRPTPAVSPLDTPRIGAAKNVASAAEAGMMARLRRAIAPPPSKSQMSDVVDAMVCELRKEINGKLETGTLRWPPAMKKEEVTSVFHYVPWTIHIEREGACAYRFLMGPEENVRSLVEAKRKMNGTSIETLLYRNQLDREMGRKVDNMEAKHFLVNLTIDSGNLSVVSGGGHVNLLEYLERKIHLQL